MITVKNAQIEKIINEKLEVIWEKPSLKNSMVLHLDTYLQILNLINSNNKELKSKIEQLIDKSYRSQLKTMK